MHFLAADRPSIPFNTSQSLRWAWGMDGLSAILKKKPHQPEGWWGRNGGKMTGSITN